MSIMHQKLGDYLLACHTDPVYAKICDSTLETIYNYVHQGWEPGGFVRACLENDLSNAIGRADHENIRCIKEIMTLIHMEVPSIAWKSKDTVDSWLEAHRQKREEKSAEAPVEP